MFEGRVGHVAGRAVAFKIGRTVSPMEVSVESSSGTHCDGDPHGSSAVERPSGGGNCTLPKCVIYTGGHGVRGPRSAKVDRGEQPQQ